MIVMDCIRYNRMAVFYSLSSVPGFNEMVQSGVASPGFKYVTMEAESLSGLVSTYKVIRYCKEALNPHNIHTLGLFRSVVLNRDNQVIGFSPVKSLNVFEFKHKLDIDPQGETLMAEEIVDGTMINVFFDPCIQDWVIATKSKVGAKCVFFNPSKTFAEMFMEAVRHCELDIYELDKSCSYSFVLQHSDHRIVVSCDQPKLYLVAKYKFFKNYGSDLCVEYYKPVTNIDTNKVCIPTRINGQINDIIKYCDFDFLNDYRFMGFMIHDMDNGDRTKIRNPNYETVRRLRGNQPKLMYHYLCLRREGNVKDYLKYYPEHGKEFAVFRVKVHGFTNALYKHYVSCYILKECALGNYAREYRTHMFALHQKYVNELREKKEKVTTRVVKDYVNQLHPQLLMHSLNYATKHAGSVKEIDM